MGGSWLRVLVWLGVSSVLFTGAETGVRFHHIHYRVGDPAAAMSGAAAKLESVRVIVPGLGVGIRTGAEYLLFDRLEESDPPELLQMTVSDAYDAAVAWLRRHGISALPATTRDLRVSSALPVARHHHIAFAADDLPSVVRPLELAGARILRSTADAVLFDVGHGLLVEIVRDDDRPETFWCPMHPDVRSADEGKCPACGMTLVAIPPPRIGEYRLDVTQVRDRRRARVPGLQLAVREPDTNALVTRFAVVHERVFHLFVVSRDLEYFAHVHPEQVDGGSFVLRHPLPPGEHMLIADFLPLGGTPQMVQKAIIVPGTRRPAATSETSQDPDVRLETQNLAAGKYARFTFTVTHAATGAPVTDLQPYLGAPAHMLLVSHDLTHAIHGHPEEPSTAGPTVSFHPLIPAEGNYKLWIQVQRAGQVITRSFDIAVKP